MDVSREEARHRSLMTDCGSMEWDLEVRKAVSCHTGALAGAFFQALNLLDSYWHGEGIRSCFPSVPDSRGNTPAFTRA